MGNSIHFRHTNRCSCENVNVFETENVSTWGGLKPPTFGFMPNALTYWAIRARHLLSHVFEYWLWQCRYYWSKVNIWNVNCARATALIFDTRTGARCWRKIQILDPLFRYSRIKSNYNYFRPLFLPRHRNLTPFLVPRLLSQRILGEPTYQLHWLFDIGVSWHSRESNCTGSYPQNDFENHFLNYYKPPRNQRVKVLSPNKTEEGWPARALTHWGREKMAAISQTTFSSAFSWMKLYEFHLRFHWSLFPRFELTIFQHWFR